MVRAALPLHQAIAILRQAVRSDRPVPTQRARTIAQEPADAAPQDVQSSASHVADLGVRLRALDPDASLQRPLILRMFIEAVLLDEMGSPMATSADFQDIVDRTVAALSMQDILQPLIDEAMDELLTGKRRRTRR